VRWSKHHSTVLTISTACVAPLLYLWFIDTYAVNSFADDDWFVVPLVHAARGSHLSFSLLWDQHNESRLVLGNLAEVLFGFTNGLDTRAIMIFNAVVSSRPMWCCWYSCAITFRSD
jgi:hypothetical protein